MLIDWFTVAAQIVNFLALIALLKHFLYERLLRAIDGREQWIAASLAGADQKNREAGQAVEAAHQAIDEIQRQHDQMIRDAKQQAEREHDQMILEARESVKALEAKWHQDLEREKAAFFDQVRSRAAAEILSIARRALEDLACADLQKCAVNSFLAKLPAIDAGCLGGDLVLRSAFDLTDSTRGQIEQILANRSGNGPHIRFERAPQMAWGLELRANGKRIGWNPESYIRSLEEDLRHAFEEH